MSRRTTLQRRSSRGGYLYVAVLLTSLVISAMGLAAISAASLRMRSTADASDWARAQILAQSAIEDALLQMEDANDWRVDFNHNVEYPNPAISLSSGTYTWKLVDDDGDLDDDDSDSVRVVGIGRVGRATAAESVRLLPTGQALTCLESSFHCPANLTLGAAVYLTTNQHVSSNGNINAGALLSSIQGNAQASGSISGSISGSSSPGVSTRRMPGSSVFDYYLDNGTTISLTTLPQSAGAYTIEKALLGPQVSPFGQLNPEGIYVLDCGGQRVRIKDSRILGTLVLINPAANSTLEGSLRWDTVVPNYPALLVSGSLEVRTTQAALDEATLSTNFNPVGVPYLGNEDGDQNDAYPAEINGLVYVSGTFNAPQDLLESRFRGVTLANNITANSSCRFNYRSMFLDYPPPGFAKGDPMQISPGSRRRETLP